MPVAEANVVAVDVADVGLPVVEQLDGAAFEEEAGGSLEHRLPSLMNTT